MHSLIYENRTVATTEHTTDIKRYNNICRSRRFVIYWAYKKQQKKSQKDEGLNLQKYFTNSLTC